MTNINTIKENIELWNRLKKSDCNLESLSTTIARDIISNYNEIELDPILLRKIENKLVEEILKSEKLELDIYLKKITSLSNEKNILVRPVYLGLYEKSSDVDQYLNEYNKVDITRQVSPKFGLALLNRVYFKNKIYEFISKKPINYVIDKEKKEYYYKEYKNNEVTCMKISYDSDELKDGVETRYNIINGTKIEIIFSKIYDETGALLNIKYIHVSKQEDMSLDEYQYLNDEYIKYHECNKLTRKRKK